MIAPTQGVSRRERHTEILGLDPHEADPVRIILAAQLRLRRCRWGQATGNRLAGLEVRRIIAARDALLSHVVDCLVRHDLGAGRIVGASDSSAPSNVYSRLH